jgi:hypothetical protein
VFLTLEARNADENFNRRERLGIRRRRYQLTTRAIQVLNVVSRFSGGREKTVTNRTNATLLILVLAAGLAGCEGSRLPTAPSTPQPQQTPRPTGTGPDTYTVADVILSGVVYEETPTGRVPIEGVRVVPDYFHVFPTPIVVTDSQGFFSFRRVWVCPCSWAPWVNAGLTSIRVEKDGYTAPAGQPDSVFRHPLYPDAVRDDLMRDVTINGDTRVEIELVRR